MKEHGILSCSSCVHSHVCTFLRTVQEANEVRLCPPYTTRFLSSSLIIATVCQYYEPKSEHDNCRKQQEAK